MQALTVTSFQMCRPAVSSTRHIASRTPLLAMPTQHSRSNKRSIVRAGAAPPPAPDAGPVWEPTGVPLVDELASFSTLKEAGIHSVKLIAIAFVGIWVSSFILKVIASKMDIEGASAEGFHPINAMLSSLSKPANALLPLYGWIYSATVVSSLIQVSAGKAKAQFNNVCMGNGDSVLKVVKSVTQLVQDASEILIIVAVAWTAVGIKDRLVAFLQRTAFKGAPGLGRLLGSFGSVVNYGIYAVAAFASIATCGINITPLLASFGGASVIIGLAAQSILGQIASAVTLYASPPFAAGDDVKFLSGGALVIGGTVVAVEPLRTVLKDATGSLIYIQNSKVADWEVQNDTHKA